MRDANYGRVREFFSRRRYISVPSLHGKNAKREIQLERAHEQVYTEYYLSAVYGLG